MGHHQLRSFSQTHHRPSQPSTTPPSEPETTSQSQPQPPPTLTHLTPTGTAHMVNITSKPPTTRTATATCTLLFSTPHTLPTLRTATLKKGDALAVARVAGIMAAKRTADLIPLAHPGIGITGVSVDIELRDAEGEGEEAFGGVDIRATVQCEGKTGVEMEALTAATVAGLTVYDMCKGVDTGMMMLGVRVVEKRGGKSGGWTWDEVRGTVVKIEDA